MKYLLLLLFILGLSPLCFSYTIVIDPGHGGEDNGAKGYLFLDNKNKKKIAANSVLEKDLSLQISKKLVKMLKKKYTVYLTRTVDRTVSLEDRAKLAEKIKADLFISVHINSSHKKSSHGHEIYYLDNHNDEAAKRVEQLENRNLNGDSRVIQKILIDLVVERTSKTSKKLAKTVDRSLIKTLKRHKVKDRGVKPGIFYVLALAKRPAILLEAGFISNKKELKLMISEKFQNDYVKAVAKGVESYVKSSVKGQQLSVL